MKILNENLTYKFVDSEIENDDLEIIEIYQGTLVDSYIVRDYTNDCYYAYLEKFKNAWSSTLTKYQLNEIEAYKLIDDLNKDYSIELE